MNENKTVKSLLLLNNLNIHLYTHTHTYIYYMCVCVCCFALYEYNFNNQKNLLYIREVSLMLKKLRNHR